KGYCVVVLEEIEKGDGDVLKMLVEVLEDGGVRDCKGGSVEFRNRILMMRWKVGGSEVKGNKYVGFKVEDEGEGLDVTVGE
ncbi:AAA family ATPase, partial [Bacillus pumilus]|uniref:AAA family ATPase n=1 Tax=Bacillus pumilus TaxID=1408 RepID=UPI0011A22003